MLDFSYTYINEEFVFYEYNVIAYSSYFSFYTDLFSIINQNEKIQNNRIEIGLLIGIICGSVAIVLIIVGIIVWFVRNHNKNLQSSSDNELDKTYTEKVSTEKIDEGIGKMVMEDVDQWI